MDYLSTIEKASLDLNLSIQGLIHCSDGDLSDRSTSSGMKLPKNYVPTFKDNIMECQSFWEQIEVSVHSWSQLTDPKELAYLRQALKDDQPDTL